MDSLNWDNIESSPNKTLDAYCLYFQRLVPISRSEKILAVAHILKENNMLSVGEAVLLENTDFLRVYAQPEEKTLQSLRKLFVNFNPAWVTLVEATCLLCLQIKTQPFLDYLSRKLSVLVIRKICALKSGNEKLSWQSLLVQNMLAQRVDNKLQLTVSNSPPALALQNQTRTTLSFLPAWEEKSVWEQVDEMANLSLHLQSVYAYSPLIEALDFNREDYTYQLQWILPVSKSFTLTDYLRRQKSDLSYKNLYKKVLALASVLDREKLVLGNFSPRILLVDEYENVWVSNLNDSYRMKKGAVLPNINRDTIISAWEMEIKIGNLRDFPIGMRTEKKNENDELYENYDEEEEFPEGSLDRYLEEIEF